MAEGSVILEERKLVHDGNILRFYEDNMRLPDGSIEVWDIVEHKFNASAVLPVLPDGRVLLVKQYRSTVDRDTWEIPAGKKDAGEEYVDCIKRELMEETGYSAKEYKYMFSYKCAIAYSTENVEIFLAEDIEKTGTQHLDPSEFINVKAWELKDVIAMIESGKIQDGKTIAAIYAWAYTVSAR